MNAPAPGPGHAWRQRRTILLHAPVDLFAPAAVLPEECPARSSGETALLAAVLADAVLVAHGLVAATPRMVRAARYWIENGRVGLLTFDDCLPCSGLGVIRCPRRRPARQSRSLESPTPPHERCMRRVRSSGVTPAGPGQTTSTPGGHRCRPELYQSETGSSNPIT
jgi:hypothetical protein